MVNLQNEFQINVNHIEQLRKDILTKLFRYYGIVTLIAIIAFISIFYYGVTTDKIILGYGIFFGLAYFNIVETIKKEDEFLLQVKEILLPNILGNYEFELGKIKLFNEETLRDSKLFSNFNFITIIDVFKKKINTKIFNIFQVNLRDKVSYGYKSYSSSIFNGLIITTKTKNNDVGNIIIHSVKDKNVKNKLNNVFFIILFTFAIIFVLYLMNIIWLMYLVLIIFITCTIIMLILTRIDKKQEVEYSELKINYKDFSKNFKIYASNIGVVKSFLANDFLDMLLKLKKIFGGANIKCSLIDGEFIIAIPLKKPYFIFKGIFHNYLNYGYAQIVNDIKRVLSILELINSVVK